MVKRAEEMVIELKELMRGGKGTVEVKHVFLESELKGKCRLMAVLKLNPGCSIGLHEHVNEEEIFYIIKGKGLVDDNGVKKEVAVGDAVITGGGAIHSVENTGTEALEIFAAILLY